MQLNHSVVLYVQDNVHVGKFFKVNDYQRACFKSVDIGRYTGYIYMMDSKSIKWGMKY